MAANTYSYYTVNSAGESQSVVHKDNPPPWRVHGLMYTASGYGNKIPMDAMVRINNRWHRVYCRIFSNSGYCYVLVKGCEVKVERYADCGE